MRSLLIARNEDEIAKVMSYISEDTKIDRLTTLYSDEEIKNVMGYYDGSNEYIEHLNNLEEDSIEFLNALYKEACINGNFEQAIAMNKYLPI